MMLYSCAHVATVGVKGLKQATVNCLHERFVVGANLLNVDVTLCVDVWLGGGVTVCHCHYAGDVLKHVVTIHFHLPRKAATIFTRDVNKAREE